MKDKMNERPQEQRPEMTESRTFKASREALHRLTDADSGEMVAGWPACW